MPKLQRMDPHDLVGFHFSPTVMRNALDLLLTGGELLPGPASLISGAIQKIVDHPGGVEAFAEFLNNLPLNRPKPTPSGSTPTPNAFPA